MTEAEYLKNLRLALEKSGKYLRHIDNFYWALSSFLLFGTGIAVGRALKWRNGENWEIIVLGSIMIALWILFLLFTRNTIYKSKHFASRFDYCQKELKIDILPEQTKVGFTFIKIMIIMACLSFCMWGALIFEYFDKKYSIFCYCYNLFH